MVEALGGVLLRGMRKAWKSELQEKRMDIREAKKGETLGFCH